MIHRYSFNDGTARDSVGTLNGTLMSGAVIANGQVDLTRGTNGYVQLPPNMWPTNSAALSLEVWVTTGANYGWNRVLQIGNLVSGWGSISINQYLNDLTFSSCVFYPPGYAYGELSNIPFGGHSSSVHIVLTLELLVAYDRAVFTLYVDGILASIKNERINIIPNSGFGGYLGRAMPDGEYLNGTIDEFRVWNVALTGSQVKQHYDNGPDCFESCPTRNPTFMPSARPSVSFTPTQTPTLLPSRQPTTISPTQSPTTAAPTQVPSWSPSAEPTTQTPSVMPTAIPSFSPSVLPTAEPTESPSVAPTYACVNRLKSRSVSTAPDGTVTVVETFYDQNDGVQEGVSRRQAEVTDELRRIAV
jgi:hypothetical protein